MDINTMLRQLGKWTQEWYHPKYKDAEKLISILNTSSHSISIYYQHTNTPILTIQYEKSTNSTQTPNPAG